MKLLKVLLRNLKNGMIRDAENFTWTNILTFLDNLEDDGSNRNSRVYQLQIDKKDASSSLHLIFSGMFEDEKKHYAKELLEKVLKINECLNENQVEEKEYLKSFKKEIRSYLLGMPIIENGKFPELFRNGEAYQFFIEVLYEFDMIDKEAQPIFVNGKLIRGFQALATAIRQNNYFTTQVFKREPELYKYSDFFKIYFDLDFNRDKMSESGKYEGLLNYYLENR